jgi:excisionase family DNA binding protein
VKQPGGVRLKDMPDAMNVQQVGQVLGISTNGTYEAIRRGEIPSTRIGRRIIIPRAAIERLLGVRGEVGN